jgi:hypothetical protein
VSGLKIPFSDIGSCFMQSANPPFNGIELDHSDSGREACTVTTQSKLASKRLAPAHVLELPVCDILEF